MSGRPSTSETILATAPSCLSIDTMSNPIFSAEEQAFTNQVLAIADPNNLGIVPGDVAVNLFVGSNIPADTLGDIWQIADSENNGFLTRKGLGTALRLMSHVQFGEKVDETFVSKPAPPPTISGITPLPVKQSTPVATPRPGPGTPRPVPPIPTRPSTIYTPAYPPITADDRAKFTRIFAQAGPVNGLLSGEKSRDVFLKSKLPVDTLGKIWSLADTQSRGSLDLTDFILGMYFIQSIMNKSLPSLPPTLSAELYQQASGGRTRVASPVPISPISRQTTGQQPVNVHMTGGSLHSASSPGLGSQFPQATGVQRAGSISRAVMTTGTGAPVPSPWAPPQQPPSSQSWDITPAEKAISDRFFATLDNSNAGFISGEIAVPFMLESKLPESVLAQIWDLADLDNGGQLDRDGFAVAMHLINGQLAGRELPASLPQSLIPPTKRTAHAQAPQRPVDDLFSLFDDPPIAHPITATPVPLRSSTTAPKPVPAPVSLPTSLPDLLGDDETAEPAPPVPDRSAEVGNLQNQLASTERSVATSKAHRAPLEKQIADYAAQIAQLESQLAAAKVSHDAETQLLSNVRTRSAEQAEQIKKLKEELIRAESDLSAVRLEKTEVETALLRDKEDVRDIQKKMKLIAQDTDKVKAELEKAKNDARLQKGLVAIAKKQLATAEADRARALEALAVTQKEIEDAKNQVKEAEEVAAATLASIPQPSAQPPGPKVLVPEVQVLSPSLEKPMGIPLPETPQPGATPSITSSKSNNPFDRLTRSMSSGASTPRSMVSALPGATVAITDLPAPSSPAIIETIPLPASDASMIPIEQTPQSPEEVPAVEDSDEDPFEVGTEPTTPPPVQKEAISFDEIFGSDDQVEGLVVTAPPEGVVQPTQPAQSVVIDSALLDDDGTTSLKEAEAQYPPIEAPEEHADDLPPLRELDNAEEDSSDDEFQSAPQTARSVAEHGQQTPPKPEEVATGAGRPLVNPATDSTEEVSDALEAATPKATETKGTAGSVPSTDEDFFGGGFTAATGSGVFPNQSLALDDFDEALGQIPSSEAPAVPFQFDSAFGDSFTPPPFSTPVPANGSSGGGPSVNGHGPTSASVAPANPGVDDFDSLFADAPPNGLTITPSTAPSLSFDDAFVVPPIVTSAQPSRTESVRSIFAANMPSPMTPPRKTGPKNKGLILNPNMPAVFHSELAPLPSERAEGVSTPALPDDVDAVKQLCGMGFTRSQAVQALEKYGYDVSKALNSLLR